MLKAIVQALDSFQNIGAHKPHNPKGGTMNGIRIKGEKRGGGGVEEKKPMPTRRMMEVQDINEDD